MNYKKILNSAGFAASMLGLAATSAIAVGLLTVDRGLPTNNLNNSAGADRSNVAWSNGNDFVSGDDFTVGNTGEKWIVTGIRTWNIGHKENEFGDEFSDTTLYFGTGTIDPVASDNIAAGSSVGDNPDVTHTPVTYAGGSDYQGSSGNYRQIWQNDYMNLHIPINGGEKYYFAVDGTPSDYYWFNHASNAALSGSTQQGADDKWIAWSKDNLSTPNICDSDGPISGVCNGGWDKSSDINVQVFATQVATDKNQCKKDGWKNLTADSGNSFKNQGDCVSYVQSNSNATGNRKDN